MRKTVFLVLLVSLLLVPSLVFSSGSQESKGGDDDQFEIAVIVKLEHPWFDDMKIGIEEAAQELGVNAYMLAPAEADASTTGCAD